MTEEAAAMRGLLRLTLLSLLFWQTAGHSVHNTHEGMLPTCEELSTSLIISQLAVLKMMHDCSNASSAAVEMQREGDAVRKEAEKLEEALGAQVDRLQATLEARQRQHMQQMFDALNRTAEDILTKLREEMREKLANAVLETETPATPAAEEPTMEATEQPTMEAVSEYPEGALTSLCGGNTILHGTAGALEVVSSGNYSHNTLCSWDLHFPTESSVSLVWEYMDIQINPTCLWDWVTVYDVTNSQDVYGRRLCGRILGFSVLQLLDVNVPGTRNLLVTFHSDWAGEGAGFRLLYRAH